MDENFNSFLLSLGNTKEDHNYDEPFDHQMVRLTQEEVKGDSSQSSPLNEDITKENYQNRSTSNWGGAKSSVAIIYPCNLCNYETCRSTSLVAHLRQHRQGSLTLETERFQIGKFVCDICNFKTRWLSSLKEHEQKSHFNNNNNANLTLKNNNDNLLNGPPYSCRQCGYAAEKLETIEMHMRRHFTSINIFGNIVRNYPCCLCDFISRQLEELQDHFNKIHCSGTVTNGRSSRQPSTCSKCDHVFCNSDDLMLHLQKHEEYDKPEYPCDYCSYTAQSIHLWRDHMESHGGVLEISIASVHHSD